MTNFISLFILYTMASSAHYDHNLYILLQTLVRRKTLSCHFDQSFSERTVELAKAHTFGTLGKETFVRVMLQALRAIMEHNTIKLDNAIFIQTMVGQLFVRSGPDAPNNESEDRIFLAQGLRCFARIVDVDTTKILDFFRLHGTPDHDIYRIELHGAASVVVPKAKDNDKYSVDFDHNLRTLALVLAEQYVQRTDMRYKECERLYRWFVDRSSREMPEMKKRCFDDLSKWAAQEMILAGNELKMAEKVKDIMLEGTKVQRQASYMSCFGRHTVSTIEAEAEHRDVLYDLVRRFGTAIQADLSEIDDFFERRRIFMVSGEASSDFSGWEPEDSSKRKHSSIGECDAPGATPRAKHVSSSEIPLDLRPLAPLQVVEQAPDDSYKPASPEYKPSSPAYSPTYRGTFFDDAAEMNPDHPLFWGSSSPAYSAQTP